MDKHFPLSEQLDVLAAAISGRVITPQHADYDALRSVAMANFDCRPAALVRPANTADVASAVAFARDAGLELAIRSGGHSTIGGSTCEGGLVIDLRDLKTIEIDETDQTAWVGAGLTAGEIVAALEPRKLIIGFGDSASVGVGGITLGGGIGYLTRKFGLTLDSLLAAEIVTDRGVTIVASETNHPDLFWALRGGGGNFGVVTRFRFRLQSLPDFVGGPLILPATAEVIAGFYAAAAAAPDELSTIGLAMTAPPLPFLPPELHGKIIFMAMIAYAGKPEDAAKALAPFRALAAPIADLVGPAPYSSLFIPEERAAISIGSRFIDHMDVALARKMLHALEHTDAPMKMLQIRVLGGAAGRVPVEATAFAHRNSQALVAFLSMYAPLPAEVETQNRWVADAIAAVTPEGSGAYVNFVGKEGKAGLEAAYPPATLARLRAIKAKYDPDNLFRLNQNFLPA